MATPSARNTVPHQRKTPSQLAGATPPVSTPLSTAHTHAAFSPNGSRSSPQHYKKSPANSTTIMGHPANGPMNMDSPLAAAAMSALGIGNSIELGLDHVEVGGLGLASLGGEDDKVKRLDAINGILGVSKGRVSEVGLERLAQRLGLSTYFEDSLFDGRRCKTLLIGGSALEVTILVDSNIVQSVTVGYPMSSPVVTRHADGASQILLRDLSLRSRQSPLTKTLDKFASNLEYLANLDKLSVVPGLDCHEALAGIFESLERLQQWDMAKLREDEQVQRHIQRRLAEDISIRAGHALVEATSLSNDLAEEILRLETMCTKHGLPVMNARDRVGLSIEYWKDFRRNDPLALSGTGQKGLQGKLEQVWALRLGCAPLNGSIYPAIRTSDKWISPAIERTAPLHEDLLAMTQGPVLDWQEPPPTMLPVSDESSRPAVEGLRAQKHPDVMFVATLEPPITFPQAVWNQLFQATGSMGPVPSSYPTFDSIFFPIPTGINHVASEARMIKRKRVVRIPTAASKHGAGTELPYETTLFIYKPVYGQTLEELPFSHPRQLVAILPVLRQYAFLSAVLKNTFASNDDPSQITPLVDPPGPARTTTAKDDLAMFSSPVHRSGDLSGERFRLDVTLAVHPVPRLHVVFPFRSATADVVVEIRHNGSVFVVSQNIVPDDESGVEIKPRETAWAGPDGRTVDKHSLGLLLEILQDLCLWTQWIQRRLG